jgi:DNA-binding MarR family transcriptional regulator
MEADAGVSYFLMQVCRRLRSRRAVPLGAIGLHCGQDLVLAALWEEEALRLSALAERLGVAPPTVTRMARRMESAGLLARRADPADARAACVHLTEAGRMLRHRVNACWQDVEGVAFQGFTPAEQHQLTALLQRVLANLEHVPEQGGEAGDRTA